MKININMIVFGLVAVLASCSEKKDKEAFKEDAAHLKKDSRQDANPRVDDQPAGPQHPQAKEEASEVYIPNNIKPKPTDDEVKQSVKKFLVNMRKSGNLTKFAFNEWDNHWIPEFNKPLGKKEDAVSLELANFTNGVIPSLAVALSKSQEDWMQDNEMRKSAIILMGLTSVFAERTSLNEKGGASAGDLPLLIGKHRDRMPPTTGDFILLRIAGETKKLLEHFPNLTESQFSKWAIFAKAQNPIYRMIALDLFEEFDATPNQSKLFYESFEEESEVGILKKLNQDLVGVEEEWAKLLIQKTEGKLRKRVEQRHDEYR